MVEEDFKKMEESIQELIQVAEELDLNYTPSMHILHKHLVALCREHGGFGDMTEDLVKLTH
jgi:hypothetical protein